MKMEHECGQMKRLNALLTIRRVEYVSKEIDGYFVLD